MYLLKLYDGNEIYLTDDHASQFNDAMKRGTKQITFGDNFIATSNISSIIEVTKLRNNTNYGVLHDGCTVRRMYGVWMDAGNPEVTINPSYYSEVVKDTVPSPEQYEAFFKDIPDRKDRQKRMMELMSAQGDFTQIGQLLKDKLISL